MRSQIRDRLIISSVVTLTTIALTFAGIGGISYLFFSISEEDIFPLVLICAPVVGGMVTCRCLRNRDQKWPLTGIIVGAGLGLVLSYLLILGIISLPEYEWANFLQKDAFIIGLLFMVPLACVFSGAYLGTCWDPLNINILKRGELRYRLPVINLGMILFVGLFYWFDYFYLADNMTVKIFNPILFYPYENFVYAIFEFREAIGYPPETLSKGIFSSTIIYTVLVLIISTVQWYLIGIFFERFVTLKSKRA